MNTFLPRALFFLILIPSLAAQTPRPIEFRSDVLPVLRQHCLSCHGPTQQMNGFRLDRRSSAMRGGTFPVIVPGNSAVSRFYLKLVGTEYGQQMPPAGRLSDREIDVLKRWIDEGAVWPDQLAGELEPKPPNPAAARLMQAIREGDEPTLARELGSGRDAVKASGTGGSTPLMYAALYGDANLTRRLLEAGADPNAANDAGTTALMWAVHDAAKTNLLLDAGANPNARADDGRTPLIIAAAQFGSTAVVKLLLQHGAAAGVAASNRTTALRQAAGVGDADAMRVLVAAGADVGSDAAVALPPALLAGCAPCVEMLIDYADRAALGAALVAVARWGKPDAVRLLLARGADANARDADGRTVLMLASHSDTLSREVVKILIAGGADVHARTPSGDTAASFAALRGGAVADDLAKAGARPPAAVPAAAARRSARTARAAVETSLPLLQQSDVTFMQKSGCVSCHNNSITAMTVAAARRQGLKVDERIAAEQVRKIATYLESWRESVLRGVGIPGGQDTVSYILAGLGAERHPPDVATDAMAYYLKARQLPDGHWRIGTHRPPLEASDFEVTAVSLRALRLYAPAPRRAEYEQAVRSAARWLATSRGATTEDRAFQLLGLAWADADRTTITTLARDLASEQRSDGGWTPLPAGVMASDAYSTGQALVALREAGILTTSSPAYQRGVTFLLNTQLEDGSWHVSTRSLPIQPYFESDFPHGRDQWISAAATGWATMALTPIAAAPSGAPSPAR